MVFWTATDAELVKKFSTSAEPEITLNQFSPINTFTTYHSKTQLRLGFFPWDFPTKILC
jgi:hypothetical protein